MAGARVLFVDDEPAIRETLPQILRVHGFEAFCAASVAQALAEITSRNFDVLITDLNIGQPGDGFTVVSAMRRTQPSCINYILTGFPALETALQAIRSQVDGYAIKPANIPALITEIQARLTSPTPMPTLAVKRLSALLRENAGEIVRHAQGYMEAESELPSPALSEEERAAYFTPVITALAEALDHPDPNRTNAKVSQIAHQLAATWHGRGFSVSRLIMNVRLLRRAVYDVANENLLILNLSYILSDLKQAGDVYFLLIEAFMRTFQDLEDQTA